MSQDHVNTQTSKPKVFLSSAATKRLLASGKREPLRQQIIDAGWDMPVDVWAYELLWNHETETPTPDADTLIDRCFAGIRNCDLFVFLLTGHHGTGIGYSEDGVLSTYLELELFAAAMLRKPVLVLRERGYDAEPDPELQDTLDLLHRTFPSSRYVVGEDDDLCTRFRRECERLASREIAPRESLLARLPDWLSRKRSQARFERELADPRLRYLNGKFQSSRDAPNPTKAALLLDQVASGKRGAADNERIMPHGAALFRLWAAMRELMDKDRAEPRDPSLALLWDRALGLWGSHASWFGLHGHLWMGPLASVQSQTALRRKFSAEPTFRTAVDVREPVGARASALYSIGQRMHSWHQRMRHFRMSVVLATEAIERDTNASEGALLIRGNAAMRIASLGFFWKLWDAEADFRRSLKLREKSGGSDASVGEATADLGLCLVLTGRCRRGLALAQAGVQLMRRNDSASGKAFLAQGLRKLERSAKLAGRRDIAAAAREEGRQLASDIEAMDQIRGDADTPRSKTES
jgi:hypothetical protein